MGYEINGNQIDWSKATDQQLWAIVSDDWFIPKPLLEGLVVEGLRRKLFDPLVKHIINKTFDRWSEQRQYHIADLFQLGYIGVVRAMRNYQEGKGTFKTFAHLNIQTEISHQKERVDTEKRKIYQHTVSLDKKSNEKGETFHSTVVDPTANPERYVINKIFWEETFRNLTDREKNILVLFADGYSMNAIAEILKVSVPLIHRIFHKALKKINPTASKINIKSIGLMARTVKV